MQPKKIYLYQLKNKKIFIILYVIFLSGFVFGQNKHIIFLDDTIYFKKRNCENGFYYNLKDSLPDGLWLLYDVNKKDSSSKDKEILIKGKYKKNLKEGTFEINFYTYTDKKKIKQLNYQHICTYFSGKKNGVEEEFHIFPGFQSLISHEEYYNGKKNGMFLSFANNGRISDIYYYNNDSLKEWNEYDDITTNIRKYINIIILSANELKYSKYFYEDKIFKMELIIKEGILKKYFVYDNNGNIIATGDIEIDIHYLNPLKTPNFLRSIKDENLINSNIFKEYLEKELKK